MSPATTVVAITPHHVSHHALLWVTREEPLWLRSSLIKFHRLLGLGCVDDVTIRCRRLRVEKFICILFESLLPFFRRRVWVLRFPRLVGRQRSSIKPYPFNQYVDFVFYKLYFYLAVLCDIHHC